MGDGVWLRGRFASLRALVSYRECPYVGPQPHTYIQAWTSAVASDSHPLRYVHGHQPVHNGRIACNWRTKWRTLVEHEERAFLCRRVAPCTHEGFGTACGFGSLV